MTVLTSAFSFILALGLLVFLHELGHFLAAKAFRVRVDVFALGFGKRLFGFRRGDTDYRVSAIPLGGYVKMAGELGAEGEPDPSWFTAKPRWQRLAILFAGPVTNIVVAVGLWWVLFMGGTEQLDIPTGPPTVERAEPGSPGAEAGLQPGDRILAVAGETIDSVDAYQQAILFRPGQTVPYRVARDGAERTVEVAVAKHPDGYGVGWDGVRPRVGIVVGGFTTDSPAARAGVRKGDQIVEVNGQAPGGIEAIPKLIGAADGPVRLTLLRDGGHVHVDVTPKQDGARKLIGIQMTYPVKLVRYGPAEALGAAGQMAWENTQLLFRTLGALVRGHVGIDVMSGPLEIARMSDEQRKRGFTAFLGWLAFLSIQLGVLNLLPIPVLDGGHIVVLFVESLLRRDVSLVVKERMLQVGFVLLMAFAAVVLFRDVTKMVGRASAEKPAAAAPEPAPK